MGREGTTQRADMPPMFWCFTKIGKPSKKLQELWKKVITFFVQGLFFWLMVAWCLGLSCILKRIPTDFRQLKISCLQTFSQFPTAMRHFEANPWTKKNHNIQKMILPGEFAQLFFCLTKLEAFWNDHFAGVVFIVALKIPFKKPSGCRWPNAKNPHVTCQPLHHVLRVSIEAKG